MSIPAFAGGPERDFNSQNQQQVLPVFERAVPVIEPVAPIVEAIAPIVEQAAPVAETPEPIIQSAVPAAVPVEPQPVIEISPVAVLDDWSDLLAKYGDDSAALTLFDYAGLAGNSGDMDILARYINALAARAPSSMERAQAMAYWANLYNALTVQVVAQSWPVTSIKQIKSGAFSSGPWKRDIVTVEGQKISLDDIEHGTLRKKYPDPRIHYMVNCASIGCPNLMLRSWSADTLEPDMDGAARAFINSDRGASVSAGNLTVSSIYKWFKEDFGGNDVGVIAHLKKYADKDLAQQLSNITKVSKDTYDWDVNAPK